MAGVIRYTLSNCQTSTGTRHQAPTPLANPPDIAARLDWLLPPRRSDSDPVNSRMNQIRPFPLAVSETRDRSSQTLPGSAAPRGGYSYPPYREKQHHSSPPSLSSSFFSVFFCTLTSSSLPPPPPDGSEDAENPQVRLSSEVDPIRSMNNPRGCRLSGRDKHFYSLIGETLLSAASIIKLPHPRQPLVGQAPLPDL